jgi:Post-transcriptional regulator
MERSNTFEQYRHTLLPALHSKREEFILLGYKDVKVEQLWNYMKVKKWKNEESRMLHQLVNDILSVGVGEYMHYATMEAFKDSQKNTDRDMESYKDLFM